MFKKKEAKRAKEYKLEAPLLPSKGPPIPPVQVPPRTYKSPYASENPELRDNTPNYPGTWKPRRDVPPVPPCVSSIPTGSTDQGSFDEDEYAAPGVEVPGEEFYDDPTDSFRQFGNGIPQPVTPPDSPNMDDMEDLYVGPDDKGWRADYQQDFSEETYDNPDDMPPPQLPPSNFSPARNIPRSPEFSPPPTLQAGFFPSDQSEENYDVVPDEFDNGYPAPVPTTPPYDGEEFYDLPDPAQAPEQEPPPLPHFSKPVIPAQNKPIIDIPGKKPPGLHVKPDLQPKGPSVGERSKQLFDNLNGKMDSKPPLVEARRGNAGFSMDKGAKKASQPFDEPTDPLSPPQISPAKRPIIQSKFNGPKVAAPGPDPARLEEQVWYKGDFTRSTSDPFLRRYKVDGGFIVRPSTNDGPGFYSISIYYQGEIRHLRIRRKGNAKYSVGEGKLNELEFDSVIDCVDFHRKEPLILKAGGEVCLEVLF